MITTIEQYAAGADGLRADCEPHIKAVRDMVQARMKSRGDKEEDCQKLCVLNALEKLERNLTGVKAEDMVVLGVTDTLVEALREAGNDFMTAHEIAKKTLAEFKASGKTSMIYEVKGTGRRLVLSKKK